MLYPALSPQKGGFGSGIQKQTLCIPPEKRDRATVGPAHPEHHPLVGPVAGVSGPTLALGEEV